MKLTILNNIFESCLESVGCEGGQEELPWPKGRCGGQEELPRIRDLRVERHREKKSKSSERYVINCGRDAKLECWESTLKPVKGLMPVEDRKDSIEPAGSCPEPAADWPSAEHRAWALRKFSAPCSQGHGNSGRVRAAALQDSQEPRPLFASAASFRWSLNLFFKDSLLREHSEGKPEVAMDLEDGRNGRAGGGNFLKRDKKRFFSKKDEKKEKRPTVSTFALLSLNVFSILYVYTHTQLIHFVQQKPTQGCKPISLQ
ncbi:uncharacterized protein LOC120877509 [Oryx dammah]|uniref:uncharacterized protein LOC120877509 n=1 Tax=Oryx dammah TaxID=59534 RepID=UPI001A9B44C3|nr:uncharacterized protein LOC120877509 [Oryx dammah]